VIFSEHFGENCMILLKMFAELWCIQLSAIFLDHSVDEAVAQQNVLDEWGYCSS